MGFVRPLLLCAALLAALLAVSATSVEMEASLTAQIEAGTLTQAQAQMEHEAAMLNSGWDAYHIPENTPIVPKGEAHVWSFPHAAAQIFPQYGGVGLGTLKKGGKMLIEEYRVLNTIHPSVSVGEHSLYGWGSIIDSSGTFGGWYPGLQHSCGWINLKHMIRGSKGDSYFPPAVQGPVKHTAKKCGCKSSILDEFSFPLVNTWLSPTYDCQAQKSCGKSLLLHQASWTTGPVKLYANFNPKSGKLYDFVGTIPANTYRHGISGSACGSYPADVEGKFKSDMDFFGHRWVARTARKYKGRKFYPFHMIRFNGLTGPYAMNWYWIDNTNGHFHFDRKVLGSQLAFSAADTKKYHASEATEWKRYNSRQKCKLARAKAQKRSRIPFKLPQCSLHGQAPRKAKNTKKH